LDDTAIVSFVTDIEANDLELSHKWYSKYGISTNSEADDLENTVLQALYNFKFAKIEERIENIRKQVTEHDLSEEQLTDLLVEQIRLDKVKLMISEKLGRIILK
ncbi:MAG: hypothetical protein ACK45H_11495, partial [Bacteroidota bacterium]